MRANNDPLATASESMGFFRVVIDQGGEVGYSSSHLAAGLVTAECSTRGPGYTYIAIAWPAAFAPSPTTPLDHSTDVDVFLDGTPIQRSSWQKKDDAWTTWCRINNAISLTVSIVGRIRTPPTKLTLVRDSHRA